MKIDMKIDMTAGRTRLEKLAQFLNENSNDQHGPVELDPELLYGDDDGEGSEKVCLRGMDGVNDRGADDDDDGDDGDEDDEDDWIGTDVWDPELLRLINETSATERGGRPADPNNQSPTSIAHHGAAGSSAGGASRLQQRLVALRQAEEDKLMAECTFRPKTGRAPRAAGMHRLYGGSGRDHGVPAPERLFLMQHDQRRLAAVARHQEEAERQFRETCTFAPVLVDDTHSKVKNAMYKVPLQERVGVEWRKREEIMKQATARADVECTFRPEINESSRRIAGARKQREQEGVVERKAALVKPDRDDGRWSINPVSERILETSEAIPSGFHERQVYFEEMRREKQAAMLREAREKEAQRASFVASLPAGVLGRSCRLERQMQESAEERIHRMSLQEADAIRRRREMRKRELDAQFSHKPVLNQASLDMARDLPSIRDRVAKEKPLNDSSVDGECTFHPDTRKAAVNGFYVRYKVPDATSVDVERSSRERAERMRQTLAREAEERVAKEMEECTFRPLTNGGKVRRPPGDVQLELMPGMDRFFEKLVMQHESEMAKKEREEEVFGHGRRWNGALTVVRPFRLT